MSNPKKRLSFLLATGFGLGLMRPAPGTWGSAGALLPGLVLALYGGPMGLLFGAALLFILGVFVCRNIRQPEAVSQDDPRIVIDEWVGQWIALAPAGVNFGSILLAFILFRIFDILKIWPANLVDRKMHTPVGIMLDDVVAGVYAALCIVGIKYAGFG